MTMILAFVSINLTLFNLVLSYQYGCKPYPSLESTRFSQEVKENLQNTRVGDYFGPQILR